VKIVCDKPFLRPVELFRGLLIACRSESTSSRDHSIHLCALCEESFGSSIPSRDRNKLLNLVKLAALTTRFCFDRILSSSILLERVIDEPESGEAAKGNLNSSHGTNNGGGKKRRRSQKNVVLPKTIKDSCLTVEHLPLVVGEAWRQSVFTQNGKR